MNEQSIRDRLLGMEKRTAQLEERFEKEKKKMLERKLTLSGKIVWLLTSLIGAYFAIHLSYLAIIMQELPLLARIGFAGGALFGAAWVVLSIRTLKRGSFSLFRNENAIHGLVFGFSVLLLVILLLLGGQAEDKTTGIQLMLSGGIFFLAFGIPSILSMRINRIESSLKEQMLRIELQMAEFADKTKNREE